jgi:hypothetical protein
MLSFLILFNMISGEPIISQISLDKGHMGKFFWLLKTMIHAGNSLSTCKL